MSKNEIQLELPLAQNADTSTSQVHDKCGTDDCCQMCDTAYTQRDWNRTVGIGKVPDHYRAMSPEEQRIYDLRKIK